MLQKTPFYDVKGALLGCKRRPFAIQKMPFYKTFYKSLTISMLQKESLQLSLRFPHYPPSLFVKIFLYSLNTELELLSYPYAYRNSRRKQTQDDDIYNIIHTKIEKKK